MNPEEVEKKAAWLLEPILGKTNSDQVIAAIRQIEFVSNVRDLTKLMMVM
jgi:hypothetical protein